MSLLQTAEVTTMMIATAIRRSNNSMSSTRCRYMLLHTALKYPALELVLGLELNQKIALFFDHVSIYLLSCSSHLDLSSDGP